MPPYTGTSYALSNLIGGVVGAQSPSGQLSRARRLESEDQLAQTQRTRQYLKEFDWSKPDAPSSALKGLAAIDPTFSQPLLNLVESERLKSIREERQGVAAQEIRGFSPGGISDEELSRIQATRLQYGLDDTRERDPLRFYPYELSARARMATSGSDTDPLINYSTKLLELGYGEKEVGEHINKIRSSGQFDYEELGVPVRRQPAEDKDRLEVSLLNNPEVSALAEQLGFESITKRSFAGADWLSKDTRAPDVEAVLAILASGAYTAQLSPETQALVNRYRTVRTLNTEEAEVKPTGKTKKVAGFGGQ